jgi:zinc transport system substrate-binding protein
MRCLLLLLCLLPNLVQAEISVVTSVRPLYQITAAIMQDVGMPKLLVKSQHSAHHFAFKPSHFRLLQQADLVIWIDRHFEAGFQRLPEVLPKKTRQLELLPALRLDRKDGHIWYSPKLLKEMSSQIARVLGELDAENRHIYDKNKQALQQQINLWQQTIEDLLGRRKPRYLLDHDFLQHFEADFGLKAVAVIHDNHDQHGGIKALQLIEQQLKSHPANCLISNEAAISEIGNNLARLFSLSSHSINSFADEGDLATRFTRHLHHFAEIIRAC